MAVKDIRVEVVDGSDGDKLVGSLIISPKGLGESYTFIYSTEFLRDGYSLGADLPLQQGPQNFSRIPGAFDDTSPDRWGRTLIRKASSAAHDVPSLYLLGVADNMRQGALRFRKDGEYLSQSSRIPKLVNLKTLINTTILALNDDNPEQLSAIKELVEAGTGSLGGAHPKVGAIDDHNKLCLVKIAVNDHDRSMLKNEYAALSSARDSGVMSGNAPTLVHNGGALVIPRFDRDGDARIPYMSAMTLLGRVDHEPSDVLEILEAMDTEGFRPSDFQEVWKRTAFGAIINNTDDHLRNHGFLNRNGKWEVSPVFDINPNTSSRTHQLGVGGDYTSNGHIEALPSLAEVCEVDEYSAHEFVENAYDSAMSAPFSANVKTSIHDTMRMVRKHIHRPSYTPEPILKSGEVEVKAYTTASGKEVSSYTRRLPSR